MFWNNKTLKLEPDAKTNNPQLFVKGSNLQKYDFQFICDKLEPLEPDFLFSLKQIVFQNWLVITVVEIPDLFTL